ncbi:glycolate oxidase subunit GlcF [Parasalinivibrio latis]|uniref:glycolate oxidase subunit GlcF n=1 Tax=Parasalinivibrio latis TaxID=2952610 RepID=UPI0030E432EC
MKTQLDVAHHTPEGREAEAILRSCVHCGFCTATCPTYQELHDERDGPRGRIYLIKQLLEGGEVTENTRVHLDRCLQCRSCETTCPSGVEYGRLLDYGRAVLEKQLPRTREDQFKRWAIRKILPYASLFGSLLKAGQLFRPLLPEVIKRKVPEKQNISSPWPSNSHRRKMVVLTGCAQPSATPQTNLSAARVLDKLGISLVEVPKAGCCGAVSYHLSAREEGLDFARRNIDAWWPAVEAGAEAIVMTASGCGSMVKEYGHLLKHDRDYSNKAEKISDITCDLSEILLDEDLSRLALPVAEGRVAVHCPCSLQHGQKLPASVEAVLEKAGIPLAKTTDSHFCCGSAGTYSLLQPAMSKQLLSNKIRALTMEDPDVIATANIGCQLHLASGTETPVRHWIELLDK